MTPEALQRWLVHMEFSQAEASRRLGCSLNYMNAMVHGRTVIPRYIALACSAVTMGFPPWN